MDKVKRMIFRANELAKIKRYAVDILFIERCPVRGGWRVHGMYTYRATMKAAGSIDLWAKTFEEAHEAAERIAAEYPPIFGDLKLFIDDGFED